MATSIAARKKARAQRKTSLRQKAQERQSKTSYKDDRMWNCERDSTGKGDAVIRFLPPTDALIEWYKDNFDYDELDAPFYINYHEHGFKGKNGKWYIEKCPTSIMERECPVCEANSELVDENGGWDAMDDNHPDKKLVRNRKRKSRYVANILVVRDPANPENEGEVKIFQYGKAIHDQIMAQLIPEFEDEEECDVADLWDGRDFKLKIVKKDGYANYDKSSWAEPSTVGDMDDDELDELMAKCHDLPGIVAESKYKSYEDLEKQFAKTQGKAAPKRSIEDSDGDDGGDDSPQGGDDEGEESKPKAKRKAPAKKAEKKAPAKKKADPEPEADSAGGDDDDDYFASLLEDD